MDNLSDDLLIEIWCRVPFKTALRCKSISKRFLALISQLQFIERFIFHQLLHHTTAVEESDTDLQHKWHFNFISNRKLLISFFPNHHPSNPQNQISLNFLGRKFDPKLDQVARKKHVLYSRIVGFSNGLFLCKKTTCGRVYHVCNPITKHWIKLPLPPPPRTGHNKRDRVLEGFVCEPYYKVEQNTHKITFNQHRFRVVRFPCFEGTLNQILRGITKFDFEMFVFSSETGQWNKKNVSCSNGFTQCTLLLNVVAHEGFLYFMGRTSVLVYDPFNNDEKCDIINFPIGASSGDILFNGHVGVCCGKIRMACFCTIQMCVKVWELEKNEEEYSWCLLHVTCFPLPHARDCVVDELMDGRRGEIVDMGMQVRAFHPYDGDVVFFQRAHRIFLGNLKSNKFDGVGYGIHGFQSLQIVSLDLPLWPTPIPSVT
ncbi:putative F-box/kelch-repeat protein At1g15680 [Cicer arietinum]|uniref:Uncharacterized protein LOC101510636 n=1 Tax=Cicer arietinum TaxID=3827 RepID=A0A1S2YQA7_CICAR|nr:uncharacterized protein LOC101510636 [Cicer arietinum]